MKHTSPDELHSNFTTVYCRRDLVCMATVTPKLRGKSNNDSENNIEISKCWKSLLSGISPAGHNPGPLSGRPCARWADCCSPPPPHAASPVAPERSSTAPLPGTRCCAQTPCAHPWSGEHLWEKGFKEELLKLLVCSLDFFERLSVRAAFETSCSCSFRLDFKLP